MIFYEYQHINFLYKIMYEPIEEYHSSKFVNDCDQ